MKKIGGFTIVELVVVIAIISILAGLSIPIYMKYQQKSKVSSYALPVVKACAYDAAGVCQELQLSSNTSIDISTLKNCQNTIVPYGSLTVNLSGSVICQPDGYVNDGTVRGTLNGITDYTAICILNNKGIECTVR